MSGHTPWSEIKARKAQLDKERAMNKAKIENVALDELTVDGDVQRSLNPRRVNTMAEGFKPDGLGVITVSRRDDGTNHVVDGQHRVAAARSYNVRAEEPVKTVKANVYTGLSAADEASLFRVLNNTRVVGSYDRFRVRIVEGDLAAIELEKALKTYGYYVSPNKLRTAKGGFQAVVSLEWVYRGADLTDPPKPGQLGHIAVVRQVLDVITSVWDHDPDAVREEIIRGLGKFLIRYGDRVELVKLVRELSVYGSPLRLHADAKQLRGIRGVKAADAVAEILTSLHNKKRTAHRLPEWSTGRRVVLEPTEED